MAERMYDPLAPIFNIEGIRDSYQQDANVNFDNRVARESLPITRMVDPKGRLNKAAIGNATPYSDASQMWEDLNANMPMGRGIDPVVFQEKYQAGKQLYDMNWANQINQLRQSGMSERKISNNFNSNPEMKQYLIENGLIQATSAKLDYGLGKFAKDTAVAGGIYGGVRAMQLGNTVPKPTPEQLKALTAKGFKWENGKIKKSTVKDILNLQDPSKSPIQSPQNKKIAERFAKGALKERKVSDLGRLGKVALNKGSETFAGRVATNRALKAALGGGNLLTRAFAGGRMGAVAGGPAGAIIGSIALPMVGGFIWDKIKESSPTSDNASIWK